MPIKTQAYITRSPESGIELQDIEYDHVAQGEVLVDIAAFSICASDLKAAAGKFHLNGPMVLGHEASGIGMSIFFKSHLFLLGLGHAPPSDALWFSRGDSGKAIQ